MTHERNCRILFINTISVINLSYTCVNCICNFLSWFPWERIWKKYIYIFCIVFFSQGIVRSCSFIINLQQIRKLILIFKLKKKKEEVVRRGERKMNRSIVRYLLPVSCTLGFWLIVACNINLTIFELGEMQRKIS